MSIINNGLLLASQAAAAGGYTIERSLRFNSADSAYLSKNFASAGNQTTWTLSCWFKACRPGSDFRVTPLFSGTSPWGGISIFQDKIRFAAYNGSYIVQLHTTQVLRDPSAWYHLVVVFDSSNSTVSDRARLYLNGVRITTFDTATYPSPGATTTINGTGQQRIGHEVSNNVYSDCYFSDVHFLDGLTPGTATDDANGSVTGIPNAQYLTDFGEFDARVWNPKAYTGSYPGNSFHLDFSDNSSAAALGDDTSGNNHDWTVNNFSVITSASTGDYVSGLTASSGFNPATPAVNAFRGALVTEARQYNTTGNPNITWTPNTPLTNVTSLRVYDGNIGDNPYATGYIRVNGGPNLYLADVGGNQFSDSWRDLTNFIPGNGTITSISWNQTNKGGYTLSLNLYAIEVNGTILTDKFWLSGNDSLRDSPTNGDTANDTGLGNQVAGNYATLNPLDKNSSASLTNGNLDYGATSGSWKPVRATVGIGSGKWYWEILLGPAFGLFGIATQSTSIANDYYPGIDATSYGYHQTGNIYNNGSSSSYGSSFTSGDLIGVAFDADNGKIWFSKNGTWQASGNPASGANAAFTGINTGLTYLPMFATQEAGTTSINFGQRPFAYTAPSGFKALCTTNLPTPTIADGSTVMDVTLYTGNGSTQTISGLGFSPDFVWVKDRSAANYHTLQDIVRGATKDLYSNVTDAEGTQAQSINAFNSDGFSVGTAGWVNASSNSYAAWAWDAGSSTVTNTSGSISSQVRANASAGFSIITGTGNGSFGHGLGVAPAMYIIKDRLNSGTGWWVNHRGLSNQSDQYLGLHSASAVQTTSWGGSPTSTIAYVSNAFVGSSSWVCYAFAPVAGYSAFGSYTGNGSTDGPFVYTGFRPRWVMYKAATTSSDWWVYDTKRSTYNDIHDILYPNLSAAEDAAAQYHTYDVLSNGFKIRMSASQTNGSGVTYIYAAFAEHPFQTARAR